jgi:hypothetical protein
MFVDRNLKEQKFSQQGILILFSLFYIKNNISNKKINKLTLKKKRIFVEGFVVMLVWVLVFVVIASESWGGRNGGVRGFALNDPNFVFEWPLQTHRYGVNVQVRRRVRWMYVF